MGKNRKKILTIALVITALVGLLLVIRFVFGGNEDDWICQNGAWVKHGNPSAPMPSENCVK